MSRLSECQNVLHVTSKDSHRRIALATFHPSQLNEAGNNVTPSKIWCFWNDALILVTWLRGPASYLAFSSIIIRRLVRLFIQTALSALLSITCFAAPNAVHLPLNFEPNQGQGPR